MFYFNSLFLNILNKILLYNNYVILRSYNSIMRVTVMEQM